MNIRKAVLDHTGVNCKTLWKEIKTTEGVL